MAKIDCTLSVSEIPTFDSINAVTISSLDDARVASYRDLRERDLRADGVFIAEGALLAERLLGSRFPIASVFATEESAARLAPALGNRAPLYVAEAELMRRIVGFDFHRGVLALGKRAPFLEVTAFVAEKWDIATRSNFVVCPGTETAENLGLVLRSAAAFGIDGVLLPEHGADPLSRRCLRQSMGSALSLNIARSAVLLQDLQKLRRETGLQLVAAVAGDAEGSVSLSDFSWPSRAALVVGNEYHGLDADWLNACDHKVTIRIAPNCDSLNVAVATGILLHHMMTTPQLV